jgi:ATP-dependent Lhr-like helicase
MRADDLMSAAFPAITACQDNANYPADIPIPDHPLVRQTLDDCLHEAMDLDGFVEVLKSIEAGKISVTCVDTREPTPFSYSILNAQPYAFLDDAPLEERRARAVATRRTLSVESLRDLGKLDKEAIEKVRSEAWPLVRDADELHDLLLSVGMLPEKEGAAWEKWFIELIDTGRATRAEHPAGRRFWVATERWPMAAAAHPHLKMDPQIEIPPEFWQDWAENQDQASSVPPLTKSDAWVALVRGRMEIVGPTTVGVLSHDLALEPHLIESALGALEGEGSVLRGHFDAEVSEDQASPRPVADGGATGTPARGVGASEGEWRDEEGAPSTSAAESVRRPDSISPPHGPPYRRETQWCARRLLARIHRLTLDSLRKQIAPISPEELMRFLLDWSHLTPGHQVFERDGLHVVIEQLQGFEIPAIMWEQMILPARVARYDPRFLDELCLSGEVVWGKTRARTSRDASRILPISFMLREDLDWLRSDEATTDDLSGDARLVLSTLSDRGALFVNDIVSATRLLPSQVEEALWELVGSGQISGDGFGAIRSMTSINRIKAEQLRRHMRRRGIKPISQNSFGGRWWVIQRSEDSENKHNEYADTVGATHASPFPASNASERGRLGSGASEDQQFVCRTGPTDDSATQAPIIEPWPWQLLTRYGVFFRDLLTREDAAPAWKDLLPFFRRMESRGEIRGGRFVSGVGGEQFALPEVVERLREARDKGSNVGATHASPLHIVIISAADPMNLVGILTSGPKVPATASNAVAYLNGRYTGHRIAGEIWIDPKLDTETTHKIDRALRSSIAHIKGLYAEPQDS